MSNISNQLLLHQQQVSQFEVNTVDQLGKDGAIAANQMTAQGDTLMNLLSIMGRAYQLQCKFHCKEAEAIYRSELTNK